MIETLLSNFISLLNEASPWLLLGLFIAGMMKVWMPTDMLKQHLGKGKLAIIKAAFIGAPLPLCSCGVIPVATELRRSGASKSATASFLVATPETGVDSISVSYALLGPVFAIYRPIAAISSAIITGLMVSLDKTTDDSASHNDTTAKSCCASKESSCSTTIAAPSTSDVTSSCCDKAPDENKSPASCCSSSENSTKNAQPPLFAKMITGIHYAATRLFDDLIVWLLIGLVFATLIKTFVPTSFLLAYGSGFIAMLLVILISIPMYICATASTPIAAGFLMAGLSPGTALVFMMAGPATNISTLGVIHKELGKSVLIRYLSGVAISAMGFGFLLDWLVQYFAIDISQQMQHSHEVVPMYVAYSCSAILVFLAIKPLRELCFKTLA